MIDLSIVIACYNCEHTITRCLESIPKEKGIEIILVNDKSTDNTYSVIKKYINNNASIVVINNDVNMGAGATRNVGIKHATRKYITFLDADDELSPDFIHIVNEILKKEFDCIIFDAENVKVNTVSTIKMFYSQSIHKGIVSTSDALVFVRGATWGKIYRRDIIIDKNIQFAAIPRNEDLVFTKLVISYCTNIIYVEKPLYKYIDNNNSLMHNNSLRTEKNAFTAVGLIKGSLLERGYVKEYNSIYFLEIVYSTTKTIITNGNTYANCKKHFKKVLRKYDTKDPYFNRYDKKYRIALMLFRLNMFRMLRLILER